MKTMHSTKKRRLRKENIVLRGEIRQLESLLEMEVN